MDHRTSTVRPAASLTSPDAIVSVRSLSKRYGDVIVLDDLTFALEKGTITGFLGPNGAGKTTTLRLLLGLATPSSGEALVFGHPYQDLDSPVRRVGAVLDVHDLHPARSGREHLQVLALAAGIADFRVEEVLAMVELDAAANRRVRTYSLGMRQRLGLAGALLGEPRLLVLDEPANGLDPAGMRWLRAMLRGFAERGGAVLVSSHLLAEVAQTVDQVLILNQGRLAASGPLNQLTVDGQTLEEVYLAITSEVGA